MTPKVVKYSTMAKITQVFSSNTTWTVPSRCYLLEVFMVGGGGGGGSGGSVYGGGGGSGGQAVLVRNVAVSPGQAIGVSIGRGGGPGAAGGTTSFGGLSAAGGNAGGVNGGAGGSTSRNILGIFESFGGGGEGGGGASPNSSASGKNGAGGYLFNGTLYGAGGGGGINTFNESTPRPLYPGVAGQANAGDGGGEADLGNNAANGTGAGGGGGAAGGFSVARTYTQGQPNRGAGYVYVNPTPGGSGGSGIVIVSYDEATFDLTTNQPGVAEGGSISLELKTRNVWNGASFGYTISGSEITNEDFSPPGKTGTITISSGDNGVSGSGSAVITAASDAFTESDVESATVSLDNGFAVTSFLVGDLSENSLSNIESKIISKADYNTIQGKIGLVLGSSSTGTASYGWGQIVQSSQVSEATRVGISEWNSLRNDIVNAWVHLYNTTPPLTSVVENALVRGNILDAPYAQYDSYANAILANRFGYHPSQSVVSERASAETTWPGTYGLTWNGRIYAVISATWPSAQAARQFFNSGGEIRISSSRSGGDRSSQNSSWTSLLATTGAKAFGGDKPGKGVDPNDGLNFYRLRNSFDVWYQASASNPYSSNTYKISARCPGVNDNSNGTALSVEFLVEWIDDYTAGGGAADQVNGTMRVVASTLEAIGSLVPSGTGNFAVTPPTITVSTSPRP